MKLLLTDCATLESNNDLPLDVFDKFGSVKKFDNITRNELLNEIVDADIVLCNKTVIDKEVLNKASNLRYIGLFATGYNNIDCVTAKDKNITVCNAGSYSTNAVVQQVLGYILMHFSAIPLYDGFVKNDGWKNSPVFSPLVFPTDEISGKTLGIVGYGNIGKALEKAALGLNMNVLVFTRTPKANGTTHFVDFDTLLASSDILSLHCPLTDKTADIMNDNSFSKMKDGSFFINTSRGGTVDETSLFKALESGKLSGAAVDVLKAEPMDKNCILANAQNIIITPHTAWAPLATRKRLISIVSGNIEAYLNGKPLNCVI